VAKIILVVLGLLAAWWILKAYRRRIDRRDAPPPAGTSGENMVQCALCGVHLPRSESLTFEGRAFCSADHRERHQAGKGPG
jgi:uncharacterized protein